MNRLTITLTSLVACCLAAWIWSEFTHTAMAQEVKGKTTQNAGILEGAWENTDVEAGQRDIIFITATHFVWVAYDKEKKAILNSAGGRWSMKDNVFTERFEFAISGQEDLVGREHTFKIAVEEDKMTTNRITPSEFKQEWKRL